MSCPCRAALQVSGVRSQVSVPDPRSYTPKHLADTILQSKSALEGERKQVTVLFVDVKGSMTLELRACEHAEGSGKEDRCSLPGRRGKGKMDAESLQLAVPSSSPSLGSSGNPTVIKLLPCTEGWVSG